jgi:hypothetical protein
LSWSASGGASSYVLQRSADGATFVQVAAVDASNTSASDSPLAAASVYYYRVKASNGAGDSPWSSALAVKTKRR